MLGGMAGLTVTIMTDDGGLLLQPHINATINNAKTSFFIIIYAFPLP